MERFSVILITPSVLSGAAVSLVVTHSISLSLSPSGADKTESADENHYVT